jgi:Rieske Fe-S protein
MCTSCHPFADHVGLQDAGGGWHGRGVSTPSTPRLPRRAVLATATGIGATAACGRAAAPTPAAPSAAPATGPAGAPSIGAGLEPVPTTQAPRPVAPITDIPVGGGRIFPDLRVVVTQPTPGEFRGFGIVCTHDGCQLNAVADGTINCPCHGSRYAITDGSVVRGPARTGLRTYTVKVDGDEVVLL